MSTFGERLKKFRELLRLESQQDLANLLGYANVGSIGPLETRDSSPGNKVKVKFLKAFPNNVEDVERLFNDEYVETMEEKKKEEPSTPESSDTIKVRGEITLDKYTELVAKAALADAFGNAFNQTQKSLEGAINRLIDRDELLLREVREALRGGVVQQRQDEFKTVDPAKAAESIQSQAPR